MVKVKISPSQDVVAADVAHHAELSEDRGIVDFGDNVSGCSRPSFRRLLPVPIWVYQPIRLAGSAEPLSIR
jgi:hypothetical protein